MGPYLSELLTSKTKRLVGSPRRMGERWEKVARDTFQTTGCKHDPWTGSAYS